MATPITIFLYVATIVHRSGNKSNESRTVRVLTTLVMDELVVPYC